MGRFARVPSASMLDVLPLMRAISPDLRPILLSCNAA